MSENDWCRSLFFHVGPSLMLMASWWMVYRFFTTSKNSPKIYIFSTNFILCQDGFTVVVHYRSLVHYFNAFRNVFVLWCFRRVPFIAIVSSFGFWTSSFPFCKRLRAHGTRWQGASINWIFNEFTIWRWRRHFPLTIFRSHFPSISMFREFRRPFAYL